MLLLPLFTQQRSGRVLYANTQAPSQHGWVYVYSCAHSLLYSYVQRWEFRHKHSYSSQTHSLCQTLINLSGHSLWPIFTLLWVKSDLKITGDLSTTGWKTHNYTLTAVCAHRLVCEKYYFSVEADTRRQMCRHILILVCQLQSLVRTAFFLSFFLFFLTMSNSLTEVVAMSLQYCHACVYIVSWKYCKA